MKFLLAFMLCLSVSSVRAFSQDNSSTSEVLTLEQAVSVAQTNNRQLKISQQAVLAAKDQILAARAQRYPQFNIQLTGAALLTAVSVSFPRRTAQKSAARLHVSGEQAKTEQGFKNLAVVLAISIFLIFLALVIQFRHAVEPLLVLAAAPYGVVGTLIAHYLMGRPFGFMAFLGIASLIGVIVSHVIVLFDFIEEMHEKGEPLEQALLDAGIVRLRSVMITVGATILALFPFAVHGGPRWQPLCYEQIGGLGVYSIFVLDLKIVKWAGPAGPEDPGKTVLPER